MRFPLSFTVIRYCFSGGYSLQTKAGTVSSRVNSYPLRSVCWLRQLTPSRRPLHFLCGKCVQAALQRKRTNSKYTLQSFISLPQKRGRPPRVTCPFQFRFSHGTLASRAFSAAEMTNRRLRCRHSGLSAESLQVPAAPRHPDGRRHI